MRASDTRATAILVMTGRPSTLLPQIWLKTSHAGRKLLLPLLFPMVFMAIWGIISALQIFPTYIVPPLRLVGVAFIDLVVTGEIFHHIAASLLRVGSGILAGIIVGVPVGFAIGWSSFVARLFESVLHVL